jgi:hypothetical protein
MFYFAYGSNLNKKRMLERGVIIILFLLSYSINELKSIKQGAVANISPCENSVVEGVLYDVETLVLLDKYEGHPKHYTK